MRLQSRHSYFLYIITNPDKTVLYTGVTNSLCRRIQEHYLNRGNSETFAGKYFCYNLLYYEHFTYVNNAIERETQIKKWGRSKKEALIETTNPQWLFLNKEVCEDWPPEESTEEK